MEALDDKEPLLCPVWQRRFPLRKAIPVRPHCSGATDQDRDLPRGAIFVSGIALSKRRPKHWRCTCDNQHRSLCALALPGNAGASTGCRHRGK